MAAINLKPEENHIREQPYYEPIQDECGIFEAAYKNQLPVLLKGPTGCGKTRFVEYMAWKLKRPLISVACHDDLTASDLVGRFLISEGETRWIKEAADYLKHMYGPVNYSVIDNVRKLLLMVSDIYRKLTT